MSKDDSSIHILRKIVFDGFLMGILLSCLAAVVYLWQPFQRGFFCDDESLMYPFTLDTVTVPVLRGVGIGLPLIAMLICEWAYLRKEGGDQKCFGVIIPTWLRGFYCAGISFGIGFCFSELATEIAKATIGRPRPFFFDLCKPSIDCSLPEWKHRYVQGHEYTCTGTITEEFVNVRKSFLSGHASCSAYTMLFLVLYLEKRMVWRGTRILRHVLQFGALMLSWYTALSRVTDYRHHWSDVLAGYALGAVCAVVMVSWCTDFVKKKKQFAGLPQFELNLNANHPQIPIS